MIQEITTFHCETCDSINIVRNGTNKCGNRQYHCKDCKAYRVLKKKTSVTQVSKQQVVNAYKERASLRGLSRIFQIARQTAWQWIREHIYQLPRLEATLSPAQVDDVLEIDELWSFVGKKTEQRWLWTALCRRTRQIVAFAIGDRSTATCRHLWHQIPKSYRSCQSFSDFWQAYGLVFNEQTHQQVGKESGQTAHMERWYNTLRQRLARYTRKTLSFSKDDTNHWLVTYWFIVEHNLAHSIPSLTI